MVLKLLHQNEVYNKPMKKLIKIIVLLKGGLIHQENWLNFALNKDRRINQLNLGIKRIAQKRLSISLFELKLIVDRWRIPSNQIQYKTASLITSIWTTSFTLCFPSASRS
jgi:hypothetical protein